jgi:hypothetical protein
MNLGIGPGVALPRVDADPLTADTKLSAVAWKLGAEYTRTTSTTRNKTVSAADTTPAVFEGTGSSLTLSSRFHF